MNKYPENPDSMDYSVSNFTESLTLPKVAALVVLVFLFIAFIPALIRAEESGSTSAGTNATSGESDLSGSEGENAVEVSGGEAEKSGLLQNLVDQPLPGVNPPESDLSGYEGESEISGGETEGGVTREEYEIPEAMGKDYAEFYDISPSETERNIFKIRPWDPFYEKVISEAPAPDIKMLGPLPEVTDKGVNFTDVAADWIYSRKSAGLTDLRGHVMIVYETTIISCDEATLDEKNETYKFFGEGRVFVDDADFTLECDELEIHDAEEEKMIFMRGNSTMVVYADEKAEKPGEDSTRRQRLEYALKQQDTTITFTDAEYDYKDGIFDAHGGVRFEQSDKYASGQEFHGERKIDYAHFTGSCEFWQVDGLWLYKHKIVEDKESPPSQGDRLKRALLSVPTTITCDEAELKGKEGWLQMRSNTGNIVYAKQDDKHAECETFTLWFKEEEEKKPAQSEEPATLIAEGESAEPKENGEKVIPPGIGSLPLVSDFPEGYIPWQFYQPNISVDTGQGSAGETESAVKPESETGETQPEKPFDELTLSEKAERIREKFKNPGESVSETVGDTVEESKPEAPANGGPVDLLHLPESTGETVAETAPETQPNYEFEFPKGETTQPGGNIGELVKLSEQIKEEPTASEDSTERKNEILMEGSVFFRQENGDWLFKYDVVREKEEDKKTVEQLRTWGNGSCDLLHIWPDDEIAEATGSVSGEQDNQNMKCDYGKYLGKIDMIYFRGNIIVNREDKHQVLSNEGFVFLKTKVYEALGDVKTKVKVDVEERRNEAKGTGEGETPSGENTPATGGTG